jgi:hypothetical protein
MSLDENAVKEELSYAYVHAVAARAGFSTNRPHRDNDSVDVQIDCNGYLVPESKRFSPSLRIQVKATAAKLKPKSKSKTTKGNAIPSDVYGFDLPIKNYNDLRASRATPIILVVFFMPPNAGKWLSHTEKGLVSRRCAYWCSLRDQPEVPNATSKTVYLPKANVFNCETLLNLMIGISKEVLP